jgi:hypothetical protein
LLINVVPLNTSSRRTLDPLYPLRSLV